MTAEELAARLRERHWPKESPQVDDDVEICNQDGQVWPCFTEQVLRDGVPS